MPWISQSVLKGATGATGPAGGVFGSVIVDFGSADNGGSDAMSVTVTVAAAWLTSTSYPIVELVSGADHLDADDLTSEELYAFVTNIQVGTSFDVEVFAPNGTQGQWLVNWGAALTGSTPPPHAASHSNGTDNVTLAESQITNLVTDLAAKTPTSRTITAGDGMSGGGDLSANRTLAVDGTVLRTTGLPVIDLNLSSGINLSQDCAGAMGIHITLTITATLVLTLAHVSPGIPVFLRVYNSTGGALVIAVAATNPSGSSYSVTSKNTAGGAEINLAAGQTINAGILYYFNGSAGLADSHLSFIAL